MKIIDCYMCRKYKNENLMTKVELVTETYTGTSLEDAQLHRQYHVKNICASCYEEANRK